MSDACKSFTEINDTEKSLLITYITANQNTLAIELSDNTDDFLTGKVISSEKIPDDNNEATISSTYEPENILFDTQKSIYYGGGIIVVPCSFNVEASIDYYIYKPDYHAMEKTLSTSDHNDHYYAVDETVEITVEGNARFEFDISEPEDIELINCGIDSIDEIEIL